MTLALFMLLGVVCGFLGHTPDTAGFWLIFGLAAAIALVNHPRRSLR